MIYQDELQTALVRKAKQPVCVCVRGTVCHVVAEGALVFVPIKCAFNVAQVSLASTTYFETLDSMGGWQTGRYLLGLGSVIFGVLLITLRPDTEGLSQSQSHAQLQEAGAERSSGGGGGGGGGGGSAVRGRGGERAGPGVDSLQHSAERQHGQQTMSPTATYQMERNENPLAKISAAQDTTYLGRYTYM